jgi:16S rRNA U1498 N3-methylase RsmE
MGFHQYNPSQSTRRLFGKLQWSYSVRLQAARHTLRCFSALGKDPESHLLPRLYVGPTPQFPTPLPRYLAERSAGTSNNDMNHQGSPNGLLREGAVLSLSNEQSHYVIDVMRMIGPGSKKGRWSFRGQAPCIRIFDGQAEWVAHLEVMGEVAGDDPSKKRRRRQDMLVTARCLDALRTHQALPPIGNTSPTTAPILLDPVLCFAPPKKKERYQWILEKSTELGMHAWMLLHTDRVESVTARDYERKGLAYVQEAAEQCESLQLPKLLSLPSMTRPNLLNDDAAFDSTTSFSELSVLLEFLFLPEGASRNDYHGRLAVLVCRERSSESTPILQALQQIQSQAGGSSIDSQHQRPLSQLCLVLVGPEGGWSQKESQTFDRLCREGKDVFWNISLGSNVLRTDTAAAAAMAAFAFHRDQYKS